jgi:D-aminopeptidase
LGTGKKEQEAQAPSPGKPGVTHRPSEGDRARRPRARQLGIKIGRYPPGRYNAITDVPGIRVGHATLVSGTGKLRAGKGPVRTGVTAILPNRGDVFHERVVGSTFILNGAGEVSGLTQVNEWGLIETPIFLTNTLSVGTCSAATVEYLVGRYPGIGVEHDVVIPVVGECDDSWLNDASGQHIKAKHVFEAIENASGGVVAVEPVWLPATSRAASGPPLASFHNRRVGTWSASS